MKNYRLPLFDAYGFIRDDLDEKEVAKCSPAQLEVLMPLLESWADAKVADKIEADAVKDKNKAETALERARKSYEAALPARTFHQEWLRTVAKQPEPVPDPEVTKKVKAALKLVEAAQEHLGECNAAILPARELRKQKRAIYTERLMAWSKVSGNPTSVGDLVKERARVETEQKLANIKDGLPTGYVEHAASTVGPSHLDRFKAGQGRGGSADCGYGRNAMRGAQLRRPRVPSGH